ncbi:ABC transporter permease [Paenibacillaceae bacterium]|nr:ABC transporter permease [Paenibacillaceae bacterium]
MEGLGVKQGRQQFKKLFGANLKMTFREKQVWFWSILYPVFLMVIFMIIFGRSSGGDFSAKLAIVESEPNAVTDALKQGLTQMEMFTFKEAEQAAGSVTREQAEQWLKDKEIDAAVILGAVQENGELLLIFNKEKMNGATSQAISGIMDTFVLHTNYSLANEGTELPQRIRLNSDYVSSGSDSLGYNDFLLTGMIALSIAQSGLFGMIGMVEMRRNGLLKRLKMTPIRMELFGMGSMAVRFILCTIQLVILTAIGVLFFKANLNVDPLAFLLMFIVGTLAFSGIGFMIAALSKTMDSYFGMANLLSFVMMFLSGIFFELNMLPDYIKPISIVLPLTYFADGVRETFVYGNGIFHADYWINMGILAAWGLITFLIGSRFYNWKAETR